MDVLLVVALVVAWALLAFEAWIIFLLLKQQGRALLGQEQLAQQIAILQGTIAGQLQPATAQNGAPQGLDVGTAAPEFALPDLEGRRRTLNEFLGDPFLLTFWSTSCGFCQAMAPELGKLPEGAPRMLLISRGDAEEHRRQAREHGWECDVLLEEAYDVSTAYRSGGTPTGYLIDAEGRTASELAIGADALLGLVHAYVEADGAPDTSNGSGADLAETLEEKTRLATERARAAGLAVRDVSTSRIGRDGLPAGTQAPDFTLPDLEGNERSLSDFAGKRVLLVFSDADCAPCEALAPELQRIHCDHDDLDVLVVSRGDAEANRRKVEEHGLECPIVLQRSWELSKRYEMFATPIAYLIDENGVIEKDVAVGPDAIRELAAPPRGDRARRRGRRRGGRVARRSRR